MFKDNTKTVFILVIAAAIVVPLVWNSSAAAQEPLLGQIQAFGFNFTPRGWAQCDGQLLPINQNTALFALLGTIYGGDGRTTFALPDLRGRVPIHQGRGPGLTDRRIGSRGGAEITVLGVANMPPHNHLATTTATATLHAQTSNGNEEVPGSTTVLARDRRDEVYSSQAPNVTMSPAAITANVNVTIGSTGNGQAFNNMPPYLTVNYCIAVIGIFPSRN